MVSIRMVRGLSRLHITNKELIPIVLAAATWGAQWLNKSVLCRCDNAAVVHIISSGTSSDPYAMALIRCLHFTTARFNIALSAVHLPGSENALADALYRNNLDIFLCSQTFTAILSLSPILPISRCEGL